MAEKYQKMLKHLTHDFPKGKGYEVRAVIYVPSTRYNVHIPQNEFKKRIQEVQDFLTVNFGGTTKISAYGTYTANSGEVIGEGVAKVEWFTSKQKYMEIDQDIEVWLKKKKEEWRQQSLSYEYQDPEKHLALHFV